MNAQRQRRVRTRAEGFRGQIMHVLPKSAKDQSRLDPLLQALYITDIGWFPRAEGHYRDRPRGANEHILIVCRAGSGRYEGEQVAGELHAGQALWIARDTPHAYRADERRPWSILWAHVSGQDAEDYARLLPPGRAPVFSLTAPVSRDVRDLFDRIFLRFQRGYAPRALLYAAHLLRHVLGRIFFDNPSFIPGHHRPVRRELEGIIDFMLNHLARPHTLPALASRARMSVSHFSKLFAHQYDRSPMKHLAHLRMREACHLMDTTSLHIKEIAPLVGYPDPLHFSRAFRADMGFSPREYRRHRKG